MPHPPIKKNQSSSHDRAVSAYLLPSNHNKLQQLIMSGQATSKSQVINDALRLYFSKETKKV